MRKIATLIAVAAGGLTLVVAPPGYDKAKAALQDWEGFSASMYRDSGGLATIGHGQRLRGECEGMAEYDCHITAEVSDQLLGNEVYRVTKKLEAWIDVPLNDNQIAALVSFAYNVGDSAFFKSTLLRKLNAGCYECVPVELRKWVLVNGKKSRGLINRREKEIRLWMTPM